MKYKINIIIITSSTNKYLSSICQLSPLVNGLHSKEGREEFDDDDDDDDDGESKYKCRNPLDFII